MASPESTSPAPASADLGRDGEEEWARLRTLLDLDRGRWLGFLFTGSPLADRVLRGRTDQVLCRTTAERVEVIEPASPGELRALLEGLFEPWPAGIGCRWISAVRIDAGDGPGPWSAAWEHLLLRLNDRRDALLRANPRGLLFSAPDEVKRVARDGAPDLWAMRNMVLEIPSGAPISRTTPATVGSIPPPDAGPSGRATPPGPTDRLSTAVRDALRDVTRQLALGAEDEAVARAHDAVRMAASESDRALARAWLSRAQEAEGDDTQAVHSATAALWVGTDMDDELAERVLRLGPVIGRESDAVGALERHAARLRTPGGDPARLSVALDQLGTVRFNLGVMQAAAGDFAQALTLNRAALDRSPVSATGRHNLSVSLNKVGDTDLALGDIAAARAHYQEALQLARRLLDLYGENPRTLRDLTLSLDRVGDTDLALGDIAAARAHYQEALQLARRLLDLYGDTPQALRDLSISVIKVGDTDLALGDAAAARAHYQDALPLARRLLDLCRDTPQALRDLAASLDRLGDTDFDIGDTAAARAHYQEALQLRRRLIDVHGDTSEALRDLSLSLVRMGDTDFDIGDTVNAHTHYQEALRLARRILDLYGDTPQALRDLAVSLDKLGDTDFDIGDTARAHTHYQEALRLARRILDLYGNTPQALRDLSVSINKVGDTDNALGDTAAARAHYNEAVQLARRILDLYGNTPQALRDLSVSINKVGDTNNALGDTAAARGHYQESLQLRQRILDLYGDTPQAVRDLAYVQQKLRDLDSAEVTGLDGGSAEGKGLDVLGNQVDDAVDLFDRAPDQ